MCGRTRLQIELDAAGGFEEIQDIAIPPSMAWTPRAEIAPTDLSPVLVREGAAIVLRQYRWGVAPPPGAPASRAIFNARDDKLTGAFWRGAFRRRRCVGVVDGWYEWPVIDGRKVKHLFTRAGGGLLYFPGVYRDAETPDEARSFATVTCAPGDFVGRYHDREPVTLDEAGWRRWLDPDATEDALRALLVPAPAGRLVAATAKASPAAVAVKPSPPPKAQGALFDVGPKKRRAS